MHYAPSAAYACPLTVILKGQILSARSPQLRFIVRGSKGTYTKYGYDVQETHLRTMSNCDDILAKHHGQEPEEFWGTIENISVNEDSGVCVEKSMQVFCHRCTCDCLLSCLAIVSWPSAQPGCYGKLFENLAAAIRNGDDLDVKWEEATMVIQIIELARKSSQEGKTVTVPNV